MTEPDPSLPPDIRLLCEPIADLQSPLFPEEALLVSRAVDKRRREFTAGRTLARRALALSHLPQGPILQDDRAPQWPPAAVGSISHCATHCAVAVAASAAIRSVGLDLETIGLVHEELWPVVFTADERRTLQDLPDSHRAVAATTGFAAKEAFYKLQYPLTRQWVGFEDVTVALVGPRRLTLACRADLPGLPPVLQGSILLPYPTLVLCLFWLAASNASAKPPTADATQSRTSAAGRRPAP